MLGTISGPNPTGHRADVDLLRSGVCCIKGLPQFWGVGQQVPQHVDLQNMQKNSLKPSKEYVGYSCGWKPMLQRSLGRGQVSRNLSVFLGSAQPCSLPLLSSTQLYGSSSNTRAWHSHMQVEGPHKYMYMGGCQNYGPLLGPLNTRCRGILRT